MSLDDAGRQKSKQLELHWDRAGESRHGQRSGEAASAATGNERSGTGHLMEEVVERANAMAALKRVRQNKGSPGVDGMTVDELPAYLREDWPALREQLLAGTYQPRPVKRQLIPKSSGGMRELGIPCVLIGSSSRPSCRCCSLDSIRPSQSTATVSVLDVERTMQYVQPTNTSWRDVAGSWTSIWRSFSIE